VFYKTSYLTEDVDCIEPIVSIGRTVTFSIAKLSITTLSIMIPSIATLSIMLSSIATLSITTFSKMTLAMATLSLTTHSVMTLSIATLSMATLSIMIFNAHAKCHLLFSLSVTIKSILLSVVMLNVVASLCYGRNRVLKLDPICFFFFVFAFCPVKILIILKIIKI
jgi:hypothetical protein